MRAHAAQTYLPAVTLYPYQEAAVDWLTRTRRGFIECPAGSGKTIIAAAALARVVEAKARDRKPLVDWLANTHEQCEQAHAALKHFPIIEKRCNVRVACWQSRTDLSASDAVIADECHHFGAPVAHAMLACSPGSRWGFSATPLGMDIDKNLAMMALFNSKRFKVERELVVQGGHIAPARVIFHDDTDPGIGERVEALLPEILAARMAEMPYLDPVDQTIYIRWQLALRHGIIENRARNHRVSILARAAASLVLVASIEHAKALEAMIPNALACYAAIGAKKRREAIAAFRAGTLNTLIATSLADEGLDVPRASNLVLACAGRSPGKIEQRTGRVLRTFAGKSHGTIHDFTDRECALLHSQHKSRLRLYKRLKYTIG